MNSSETICPLVNVHHHGDNNRISCIREVSLSPDEIKVEDNLSSSKDKPGFVGDMNQNNDDDGDDPVVMEFKVMLNRDMEDWACLLRYPHQPAARVAPKPVKARMRPINDMLEIDYNTWQAAPQEQSSKHFDLGGCSENVSFTERSEMENKYKKQTLQSKRVNSNGHAYAMGLVDQAARTFHLIPMHGIYEMCPVLQTMHTTVSDELLAKKDPNATETNQNGPTPISVIQFRKQSQHAHVESEKLTYQKMIDAENSEPWIDMNIIPRSSNASWEVYQKHQTCDYFGDDSWIDNISSEGEENEEGIVDVESECENTDINTTEGRLEKDEFANTKKIGKRQAIRNRLKEKRSRVVDARAAFNVNTSDYLKVVAPQTRRGLVNKFSSVASIEHGSHGVAIDLTSGKVSLEGQVKQKLFRKGVVMFSDVVPVAQATVGGKSTRKILDILIKYAHLVRGAWVLKSQDYCREKFGETDGNGDFLELQRKCAVRDLIICLIASSETGGIRKDSAKEVGVKISTGELQAALMSVCLLDKETKLWRLKNVDKDAAKWEKAHSKLAISQRELLKELMFNSIVSLNVGECAAGKHTDIAFSGVNDTV